MSTATPLRRYIDRRGLSLRQATAGINAVLVRRGGKPVTCRAVHHYVSGQRRGRPDVMLAVVEWSDGAIRLEELLGEAAT